MKRILLAAALLCVVAAYGQRTFVVTNADGVDLKYEVMSTNQPSVWLTANHYSGSIVLPSTVQWNDTVWTVDGVYSTAFRNQRNLRYVHFPSTIVSLPMSSLVGTTGLDSLRFDSPVALSGNNPRMVFGSDYNYSRLSSVSVPCGSLAGYRRAGWNIFRNLKSDCGVGLTVVATEDSVVRLDSVIVADGTVRYAGGWYEIGDTAVLAYEWFGVDGFLSGTSTGTNEIVVTGPDTVYFYTGRAGFATIGGTNNISTPVSVIGTMSYRHGLANYFVTPDNKSTIYSSSLWISGSAFDGDNSHVAAHRYWGSGDDFGPGPLRINDDRHLSYELFKKYNHVWHITREMIDYHIAHCGEAGYEPAEDILTWPGNGDTADGFAAQMAPYYDADGDGRYRPLAGDYPLIRGDEATFSIFNDYTNHDVLQGSPLFVEIHCMSYVFNEPQDEAMQYTLFQHFDIYNRSANDYSDVYLGLWSDFDMGYALDDYIGCDVMSGMYYGYNGTETDGPGSGAFSGIPPAQSCTFLAGALIPADGIDNPAINEYPGTFTPGDTYGNMGINGFGFGDGIVDNERMGMTNFVYYNNSTSVINGEPRRASDYYNLMRSQWKNGTHVKYGSNGLQGELDANFMYPGISDPWHWCTGGVVPPSNPDNWNESTSGNSPGDRRGVGSSGPFTFAAGSMQQLDIAYTTAWGETGAWSSVEALGNATANVRRQFCRDTTDSGKPFVYRPYSAPHEVGINRAVAEGVSVYPNPASGTLNVRFGKDGAHLLQLFDMKGRLVMQTESCGTHATLQLAPLPQGVYMLRTDGTVQRIVKD